MYPRAGMHLRRFDSFFPVAWVALLATACAPQPFRAASTPVLARPPFTEVALSANTEPPTPMPLAEERLPAPPPPAQAMAIRAARRLDVKSGVMVKDAVILVEKDRIRAAGQSVAIPDGVRVVDLGDVTVLPGLIDAHTHLLLRKDHDGPDQAAYTLMLATKSQAYRALEGAASARQTLEAGFTTVRDLSDGAGYADAALRDAVAVGLVPGPRMLVATRGIASVGRFQSTLVSPDLAEFPTGAQMVSGVEEARRAVREQLGHGADVIKVFADAKYVIAGPVTQTS